MDGYRTPPSEDQSVIRFYEGGSERDKRIDEILGINNHENDSNVSANSISMFNRSKKFNPELLTYNQYLQLSALLEEEKLILDRTGEPRSAILDRLRDYQTILLNFKDFEPFYQNYLTNLHFYSPSAATKIRIESQKYTLPELYKLIELPLSDLHSLNHTF